MSLKVLIRMKLIVYLKDFTSIEISSDLMVEQFLKVIARFDFCKVTQQAPKLLPPT